MEEDLKNNYKWIKEYPGLKTPDKILLSMKAKPLIYMLFGFIFILFVLFSSLYFFTPLKEVIPGFPDTQMKLKMVSIQKKVDSLELINTINKQYIDAIKLISNGETLDENINLKDTSLQIGLVKLSSQPTDKEKDFRNKVEESDKYNTLNVSNQNTIDYSYYTPIQGLITSKFNPNTKHYGIDLVATENAPIKAVQYGTVIFSGWTSEDGYVICIQHSDNVTSIYKHNSSLLKKIGENVLPGEVIALIGNTGELSQGAHLHLEIWQNGYPIDPEKVINF